MRRFNIPLIATALALSFTGACGCGSAYGRHAIVLKNGTSQEIKDATVTYDGFRSLGGGIAPGGSKGDMGPPKGIPNRATVEWTTPDGQRHEQVVEVAEHVPKGFDGNVIFTIREDGSVELEAQERPDLGAAMAADWEEVALDNNTGQPLRDIGVAYGGFAQHTRERGRLNYTAALSAPRPDGVVPERATVSWESMDGAVYQRRVAVAARLPRGFAKDINFTIQPDGSVSVRPADRGDILRVGRRAPPDKAAVSLYNGSAGPITDVEVRAGESSLRLPRLEKGKSPPFPLGVAELPEGVTVAWRDAEGRRHEQRTSLDRLPERNLRAVLFLAIRGDGAVDARTVPFGRRK